MAAADRAGAPAEAGEHRTLQQIDVEPWFIGLLPDSKRYWAMILRRILSASWKAAVITFVGLVSIQVNIHFQFLLIDVVTYLSIPVVMFAVSLSPEISGISFQVGIAANFLLWMVVLIFFESFRPPRKRVGSLSILKQ